MNRKGISMQYIREGSLVRDKAIDYIGFVEEREDSESLDTPTRYRVRWMTHDGGHFYTYAYDGQELELFHEFDI